MSLFSDDPWVALRSPIDALKLHALGNVTLAWNYCELNLVIIFTLVTETFDGAGWLIARDLGDITLMNKMREILELKEKDETVRCRITHMFKVYDACRVNRNHLSHFSLVTTEDGGVGLARRKGPTPRPTALPSELDRHSASGRRDMGSCHLLALDGEVSTSPKVGETLAIAWKSRRARVALETSPSSSAKSETPAFSIAGVMQTVWRATSSILHHIAPKARGCKRKNAF